MNEFLTVEEIGFDGDANLYIFAVSLFGIQTDLRIAADTDLQAEYLGKQLLAKSLGMLMGANYRDTASRAIISIPMLASEDGKVVVTVKGPTSRAIEHRHWAQEGGQC